MVTDITAIAGAARAAGVTHLRLRSGPVREMILLPADPPVETAKDSDADKAPDPELARREREARLRGGL